MTHVPYKGNAPAITDLLGARTTMIFATMPTVLPHVKAGKLRALAVVGNTRSAALPELPTVGETIPGFELINWIGLFAPRARRRRSWRTGMARCRNSWPRPRCRNASWSRARPFRPMSPEQFAAFVRAEAQKWATLIPEMGIRPE
jgi:tripartite-type tricarboxylate transporter receptor subunit TctC